SCAREPSRFSSSTIWRSGGWSLRRSHRSWRAWRRGAAWPAAPSSEARPQNTPASSRTAASTWQGSAWGSWTKATFLDRSAWTPQPMFSVLAEAASLDPLELFGVLNMGIGMIVAVPPHGADRALGLCRDLSGSAVILGEVVKEPGIRFASG